MLSTAQQAKAWSRFFCHSVYVTMYLNDHARASFYESLGLNTTQFNRCGSCAHTHNTPALTTLFCSTKLTAPLKAASCVLLPCAGTQTMNRLTFVQSFRCPVTCTGGLLSLNRISYTLQARHH